MGFWRAPPELLGWNFGSTSIGRAGTWLIEGSLILGCSFKVLKGQASVKSRFTAKLEKSQRP